MKENGLVDSYNLISVVNILSSLPIAHISPYLALSTKARHLARFSALR